MNAFIDKSLIEVISKETGWDENSVKLKIIDHILDVRVKLANKGKDPNVRGAWTRSIKESRFFIRIKNDSESGNTHYEVTEAKILFVEVIDITSFRDELVSQMFEENVFAT